MVICWWLAFSSQCEWDVAPGSILVGRGCPICGRLKSANKRRRTQEEYVAELYAINPNIEVMGTYILSQQKLLHKCKICGHEWEVAPNSLLQGYGCPKCADIQNAQRFSKGHEQYVKELSNIHPNIEVLGEYINAHHKISHKCKICGHIWNPEPDRVLHGAGCPVCIGKKIGNAPEYTNSIWVSDHREYFSNYLTEDQMKSYMPYTNKKIKAICPYCKKEKMIAPGTLFKNGLGCVCSDGQTYPNKFVWCVLNQLGIDYIPEYCPSWISPKRYDIYIPSLNCIIENHGPQHYEQCTFTRRSLQEEQENDKYKLEYTIFLRAVWEKEIKPVDINGNIYMIP